MATIPWSAPTSTPEPVPSLADPPAAAPPADGGGPVVMASRFRLTSRRHTVAMLRHALRVRRALLAAPGALGVSLVAHPLRGEYWTLSGWADRPALDAFVSTPEHRAAMRRLAPAMADSAFVFWPHDSAATPPTWVEARDTITGRENRWAGRLPAR